MKVRIIGVTEPTEEVKSDLGMKNGEDIISYCARVSNPSNQTNFETGPKLLKYLINHAHWSPLEMVNVVMEIETTRTIGRQILRHRFNFQEFSGRYAKYDTDNLEFSETRLQDLKNRQNSIETDDKHLIEQWETLQKATAESCVSAYNWALNNGIAKELARNILPEGLTPSRMFVNGTLRNWFHYCQLRQKADTQKEHREVATAVWNELVKKFPLLEGFT